VDEISHVSDGTMAGRIGGKVGTAIKLRRTALGMTMAELARLAGVSGPYISLLERGRSSISLETLYRVAEALGTGPNLLLPEGRARAGARKADRPRSHPVTPADLGVLSALPGEAQLRAMKYCLDYEPSDTGTLEWQEHHGESFVYMLHGRLLLEYDDGRRLEVGPGESVHSAAGSSHRCAVISRGRVEILVVNTDPAAADQDVHVHPNSSST